MDRLTLMRSFKAVVERGTFAAGAEYLDLSNQQISKHVAALEQEVGVRLLERTTRRLALTEMGRQFYEGAIELLARQDELWSSMNESQKNVAGQLRLTAPQSYGDLVLAPLLSAFLESNPNIQLRLNLTDSYVDLIEAKVDAAVRIGELNDSSLVAAKIGETSLVFVASPDYLERVPPPKRPIDLQDHKTIVDRNYRGRQRWRLFENGQETRIAVDPHIEVNSPVAAKQFALAGQGIAMSPSFMVQDELSQGRLVSVLDEMSPSRLGIYVVYPGGTHLSPKVRAFVDFMKSAL